MSGDTIIDMPVELTNVQATPSPFDLQDNNHLHNNNSNPTDDTSFLIASMSTPTPNTTSLRKPSGIILLTVEADAAQAENTTRSSVTVISSRAKPARWKTPEFLFYAVAFVIVVPMMVMGPVRLSEGE